MEKQTVTYGIVYDGEGNCLKEITLEDASPDCQHVLEFTGSGPWGRDYRCRHCSGWYHKSTPVV